MEKSQELFYSSKLVIQGMLLPSFRVSLALQEGCDKKILIGVWGGIGDQICAEPTLRYAINRFKDCEISLTTGLPELFSHLKFKEVFGPGQTPDQTKYLCFTTQMPQDTLANDFFCQLITHCVDYCSLAALRMQLPVADREVILKPEKSNVIIPDIAIHPGKHWATKTFPKSWWDQVIARIVNKGHRPMIIGATHNEARGTVDVDTYGCVDVRDKLTLMETIYMLQRCKVLLTNDSSPLHMAATGDAWIGFVATCKHPDLLTHWRKGQWGWKMQNHGVGGYWDLINYCPNQPELFDVSSIDEKTLLSWLPNPKAYADWACERVKI